MARRQVKRSKIVLNNGNLGMSNQRIRRQFELDTICKSREPSLRDAKAKVEGERSGVLLTLGGSLPSVQLIHQSSVASHSNMSKTRI